jgi:hypothetical protein
LTHPGPSLTPNNHRLINDLGYYISSISFKGPFHNVAAIEALMPTGLHSPNIYCVKKTLQDRGRPAGAGEKDAAPSPSPAAAAGRRMAGWGPQRRTQA